jgi:hypothetical protein
MEKYNVWKEVLPSFKGLHLEWLGKAKREVGALLSGVSAAYITHFLLPGIGPVGKFLSGYGTDILAAEEGYRVFHKNN